MTGTYDERGSERRLEETLGSLRTTRYKYGSAADMGIWGRSNEELFDRYVELREATSTARTYRTRIHALTTRAALGAGRPVPILELVLSPIRLADALLRDVPLRGSGTQISKQTIKQTLTALRDLVAVLPVPGRSRLELDAVISGARRRISVVRGTRLLIGPGRAARLRPVRAPRPDEIECVIAWLRTEGDLIDHAVADVLAFLYLTGVRVGATLGLQRADVSVAANGSIWVHVHEKSRPDDRPVRARTDRPELVPAWLELPPGTSLWTVDGKPLTYKVIWRRLGRACTRAGSPGIRPHELRHAFARDVAWRLGLEGLVHAGGWRAEPIAERYLRARP